jgi:hypothetical protein
MALAPQASEKYPVVAFETDGNAQAIATAALNTDPRENVRILTTLPIGIAKTTRVRNIPQNVSRKQHLSFYPNIQNS